MKSFFFGSAKSQLFGVYHSPKSYAKVSKSVLLCSPLGHEYMQSYRIMRKLAEQLAAGGHHVLRFDWTGYGDSCGAAEDGSIEKYIENIQIAADELLNISSHTSLSLIGLRFGAVLSWLATASLKKIDMLSLWKPVISGSKWLDSIAAMHEIQFKTKPSQGGKAVELLGVPFSHEILAEIRKCSLFSMHEPNCNELYLYTEHTNATDLKNTFVTFNCSLKMDTPPENNTIWENPYTFDRVIMTSPAISSLCTSIDGGAHHE